jgi:GT2 family glycosyltransferase
MERRRGYGRGFERTRYSRDSDRAKRNVAHVAAGRFGTGANMAFRRTLFDEIGPFDPALGAGTITQGCEEIEMFFRLIESGHSLVYEPAAIVWHRHFRELRELQRQSTNYAVAFTSYLVKITLEHPSYALPAVQVWLREMWRSSLRPLAVSFLRPDSLSRDLSFAELRGFLLGLPAYPRAKRDALAR